MPHRSYKQVFEIATEQNFLPTNEVPHGTYTFQPNPSGTIIPTPLNVYAAESVPKTKTPYQQLVDKETEEIAKVLSQEDWETCLGV